MIRLETKYLRLKTPVTLGSRFDDWEVTWLGGWTRDRLSYLIMVVRVVNEENDEQKPIKTDRIEASRLLDEREILKIVVTDPWGVIAELEMGPAPSRPSRSFAREPRA